jgi:hypothetical protein
LQFGAFGFERKTVREFMVLELKVLRGVGDGLGRHAARETDEGIKAAFF